MKTSLPSVNIMDIPVHRVFLADLLQQVRQAAETGVGGNIFNVNIHALNLAWEDPEFRHILQTADQIFVDGAGVMLAAKLFGWSLGERFTFADWMDDLFVLCTKEAWPVFWLGDTDKVGEIFQKKVSQKHPNLIFAGRHHGFFSKQGEENEQVIAKINASGAKVLMVGMSMPIQEKWLAKNRHRLNAPVRLPLGGAARIVTGHIKRGPRWMTDNGLEWLYRLAVQPRYTWRRYVIGNPLFFCRLFGWYFLKIKPKQLQKNE